MSRRLETGGAWIDRSKPLRFAFDGAEYEGFEGDTLASALVANGIVGGFRSPILGRPRGVMTDGTDEPNAFVAVLEPWVDLITPATTVPLVDGLVAQARAGVADLADTDPSAGRVRHAHRHVETLVVGGGDAGREAAREASSRGDRVILVEERSQPMADPPSGDEVILLADATALGVYDDGYVVVHERVRAAAGVWRVTVNDGAGRVEHTMPQGLDRIWHVRAGRVVLATGAFERPLAFVGNDRPGVMLASSAMRYVERFAVLPGDRTVAFVTNDWGKDAAERVGDPGAELVDVVDVRDGRAVIRADGDSRVASVTIREADGSETTIEADLLLVSGGWNPNLGLWRAIGGGLTYDEARACFVPDGAGPSWLSVVGAAAGALPASAPLWFVEQGEDAQKYVDLQRDQTVSDVRAAVEAGLRSVEHVKRATYIGTAVDQGRTSGVLTAEIVNTTLGWDPGAQGPSSARPPYAPVSFGALAGPYRGALLDPIRVTPIHTSHVERGAPFENVGQWKRPWYFPRDGESTDDAVARECLAVRNAVGAMDASTLGKIDVVGPDAPAFLDRMYTNRMSNLKSGSIRYGLMCGLDGMVFDDGVAMRLAEDRYLVTTTTGGAARVLDHFEEWLQTEWTDLRVFCTSVTEQWAVVALNGPRARDVLAAAGTDVDLAKEAFPHMTFRDGTVAGVPARLARVSFSGELAFEVHVSSWHGRHAWDALIAAGEPFGIAPYGTEAMHVLRAEKGYVIVGQDTDATVTPFDLGMDWIVNPSKGDFIGRRSFSRPDTARPDRKQLVGLLPQGPEVLLPEGMQLVLQDTRTIPMPMAGHVTSSYRSAALGRTFALAMLKGGHAMHGRTVFAPLPEGTVAATVTAPVFYDPEGSRRDG
ncbi:MAG: glycine cleavage T C-terminal barrel domain-containing protein [Actinomycetota bacterium]